MTKTNPSQFMRQVKQEVKKVTWPTRKETTMSAVMVIILTALASCFFFFVDVIFSWVVQLIFGIGG